MNDKKIVEFQGLVMANPYNSENYKIYGLTIDSIKYPEIKMNKYSNVSISGSIPDLENGVEYNVKAEESIGKHGYEYKVINIKRDLPKTEFATRLFLMEILQSKSHVDEIMANYPDIIDRVINNRLDDIDLNKLYNIKEFRFNVIKRKILENFALAQLVDDFKGLIEFKILKVLFDKYDGSIEKIKDELTNDPYKCLCGLSRIAFKTADTILLELNKECKNMVNSGQQPPIDLSYDLLTSYQRQKAAIMFLLEENENDGNTKIDIKKIRKQVEILANQSILHFADVIKNDVNIYFDKNTSNLALKETYNTEKYIADRIIEGLKINNKWEIKKDKDYSKFDDIQLTEEQIKTINIVCDNNISILRGGAGMGKSQSTKAVINMLKDNHKSFVIFSPTGRAAKVISEFTKEQASTIHRGLGYIPPNWSYNEEYPLYIDIIIVDESSMIDIFLMKHLLEAIDFNKTKILFIGDSNQVPSVGAGNVFFDMIDSNIIPINTLTKVFRYGTGGILTVATQTWKCEKFLDNQTQPQIFGEDKGYMFIPLSQENILSNVIGLYKKLLTKGYLKEDIMILSSYNKGDYGTVNINKHLQPISNPNVELNGNNIILGDIKFYEGDLVIQTKNNYKAVKYSLNSFAFEDEVVFVPNGEIGIIKEISYNSVIIEFSDVKVIYSKEDLINVKLAYSISIHKSQGGQAKVVILLTPKSHIFMLNSNLIYVGQTRAKERVFHFGEIETVNKAIKKKADFNRNTFLKDLLI